jgi:archaellum biogenesis protein FlaJ (TadC family)
MQLVDVTAQKLAGNDVCAIATDRYHRIALWRQLFTVLIFAVAVVITVFLVLTIVFATNKEWAATIATGLGTVVSGVPLRWVLKRRGEAKAEEEKAFDELKDACDDTSAASAIESNLRLLH